MKISTLEEACHAAWRGAFRGLRSQGWEHSTRLIGVTYVCSMRDVDGHACAVGWLFSGGPELNRGNNCSSLLSLGFRMAEPLQNWWDAASEQERESFLLFTVKLQQAHDMTWRAVVLRELTAEGSTWSGRWLLDANMVISPKHRQLAKGILGELRK